METAIFETVFDNLSKSVPAGEEEYISTDGLLYCGKCKTPVECIVEAFGKQKKVRCICKCQADKYKAEEEERRRRDFEDRVKRLRRTGFAESEMQSWTFAADDMTSPKISKAMQAYCEHFAELRQEGKGLLLYGSVGTGKTFAAACVANALIDKGYPVIMTNFNRIINRIQASFDGRNEFLDELNSYPLLIIDDLATERNTDFVNEIVYSVIDARYRAGLPMIITTNLTAAEMSKPSDISKERIYSRILERCHPVEVSGSDRRKMSMRGDYKRLNEMLGL